MTDPHKTDAPANPDPSDVLGVRVGEVHRENDSADACELDIHVVGPLTTAHMDHFSAQLSEYEPQNLGGILRLLVPIHILETELDHILAVVEGGDNALRVDRLHWDRMRERLQARADRSFENLQTPVDHAVPDDTDTEPEGGKVIPLIR